MPRFVILAHDWPFPHYDFMLEWGCSLRTWRIPEPPTSERTLRTQGLPEHRLAYLDYEGPLSGDRGRVTHWDWGAYEVVSESSGVLTIDLSGRQINGRVNIIEGPAEEGRMTLTRYDE